jgi:hypothetical protein
MERRCRLAIPLNKNNKKDKNKFTLRVIRWEVFGSKIGAGNKKCINSQKELETRNAILTQKTETQGK